MPKQLYLTDVELKELGVDLTKLNSIRRKAVLDEKRVFITVATLRELEDVASNHGLSFVTPNRYSKINKHGIENLEPGTILGPMHTHGNFMVSTNR